MDIIHHYVIKEERDKDGICILDKNGISHQVKASGHWITFPSIDKGVGKVRQRYPIFPIHYGNNQFYKGCGIILEKLLIEILLQILNHIMYNKLTINIILFSFSM